MKRSLVRTGAVCLLCLVATATSNVQAQSPLLVQEFIYTTAPFPSCHASTILETSTGLVAAWFGGTGEGQPDVCIYSSRKVGNNAWSTPVQVATGASPDGNTYPCWNPALYQPTNGPVYLFYKVGPSPRAWWGMVIKSTDNGLTWGQPIRLPDTYLGPIKNKPVDLGNGQVLMGSSTEGAQSAVGPFLPTWQIHFEKTTNLGLTLLKVSPTYFAPGWSKIKPSTQACISTIQPSILFLGGQNLMAIGRTNGMTRLFQVRSTDLGKTWGPVQLTQLPNPNAGTDAVTLKDGRHVLAYNHTIRGRSPLNLSISTSSDAYNWNGVFVLENEPDVEFSYPAVIQGKDGKLHVTYTWKRQRIRYAKLDPSKFQPKPIVDGNFPAGIPVGNPGS